MREELRRKEAKERGSEEERMRMKKEEKSREN
jgi:hypothetical protein